MLSSNMCFFTKYQTVTHVLFAVKRFVLLFWLKKMKNEFFSEIYQRENQNMSYENNLLFSSLSGDRFHTCRTQPNNTESVQHIWYSQLAWNRTAINQSGLSFPFSYVSRRCSARDKHFVLAVKLYFDFRVILKCKLLWHVWVNGGYEGVIRIEYWHQGLGTSTDAFL